MNAPVNAADFGLSVDGTGETNTLALQAALDASVPPVQAICRNYPGLRFLKGYALSFANHLCYEDEPESIVGITVKIVRQGQPYLYAAYPRARHHHLICLMEEDLEAAFSPLLCTGQGFLTSMGRHVDRTEARQIAESRGQLLTGTKHYKKLFSEEIW